MLEGLAAVERLFLGLLAEDMGRDERNRLEELCEAVLETLRGQAISAVLVANGALADAGFSPLSAGHGRRSGQRTAGPGMGHASGPFASSAGQASAGGTAAVSIFGPTPHPPHFMAMVPPVGSGGGAVVAGGVAVVLDAAPRQRGVKAPPVGFVPAMGTTPAATRAKPPPPQGPPPVLPAGAAAFSLAEAGVAGGRGQDSPAAGAMAGPGVEAWLGPQGPTP